MFECLVSSWCETVRETLGVALLELVAGFEVSNDLQRF